MSFKRLKISAFQGLDQSRGIYNENLGTSPDSLNFVSRLGALITAPGAQAAFPPLPQSCVKIEQAFFRDAQTHRDRSVLMAMGPGKVYALVDGVWKTLYEGADDGEWSCVNYRHEADDWFILTGASGMKYWDGKGESLGDLTPRQAGKEVRFERLTLLYERLWGAVRADEPDRLYWSERFSPEDWELNYETPDSGGGFIDVATFDGSRIRAIVAAFDDVLIFKDRGMHRLNGTYPGEFSLTQVYGAEGTLAAGTIVHTADRLYFLGADGLCVYNGMTVSSLAHSGDRRLREVWKRMNAAAIWRARACIRDDVLYLALPLDGAEENSHVIEYSLQDGAWSLMDFAGVNDWLLWRDGQREELLCLVGEQICRYGVGTEFHGRPIAARWISPEITLGTIASKKTVGRVYMNVVAHARSPESKPAMKLSLISGTHVRTHLLPLREGENQVHRRIRMRGRAFRFQLENVDGCSLAWRRGLEIIVEEDEDR